MQNKIKYSAFMLLTAAASLAGCKKIFDVPEEKDYLSTKIAFTTKDFTPILGRTTLFTNIFSADNSTFPMTFEMLNPHFGDGRDANHIQTKKDVQVWLTEYTGAEKSIAEIEAKRKTESHPVIEMRNSGELIVWNAATSDIIKPRDSVIYPQDIIYFDVKVTNSGGTRVLRDLSLIPSIELPYEPNDDINKFNGKPNTTTPGGKTLVHNYPSLSGMVGESTNSAMDDPTNPTKGLVYTYIRKVPGGTGNSLRFKFLNKDSVAINPARFNETKWDQLVHGFNMEKTDEYVKYEVAYPIPLARIPTKYTAGGVTGAGTTAHVEFSYSRIGFGNVRQVGVIAQDFKIFEKGDWEIVFHFKTVNPKFDND